MKIFHIIKYAWKNDQDFFNTILTIGTALLALITNTIIWGHYVWPFTIQSIFLRWLAQITLLVLTAGTTWVLLILAGIGIFTAYEAITDWYKKIVRSYEESEEHQRYLKKQKEIEEEKLNKMKENLGPIYSEAQKPASPEEIDKDPSLRVPHTPGISIF